MGIWHSVFFSGESGLSYVSPKLVRKGVVRWKDLVTGGVFQLEHLEVIAYTWKMVYDMGVQDVRLRSLAPDDGSRGLPLDQWGAVWGKQHTLLLMQTAHAECPRQLVEVWQAFNRLFLPKWDLDFMRRTLWKSCPLGVVWATGWGINCTHCVTDLRITNTCFATVDFLLLCSIR